MHQPLPMYCIITVEIRWGNFSNCFFLSRKWIWGFVWTEVWWQTDHGNDRIEKEALCGSFFSVGCTIIEVIKEIRASKVKRVTSKYGRTSHSKGTKSCNQAMAKNEYDCRPWSPDERIGVEPWVEVLFA